MLDEEVSGNGCLPTSYANFDNGNRLSHPDLLDAFSSINELDSLDHTLLTTGGVVGSALEGFHAHISKMTVHRVLPAASGAEGPQYVISNLHRFKSTVEIRGIDGEMANVFDFQMRVLLVSESNTSIEPAPGKPPGPLLDCVTTVHIKDGQAEFELKLGPGAISRNFKQFKQFRLRFEPADEADRHTSPNFYVVSQPFKGVTKLKPVDAGTGHCANQGSPNAPISARGSTGKGPSMGDALSESTVSQWFDHNKFNNYNLQGILQDNGLDFSPLCEDSLRSSSGSDQGSSSGGLDLSTGNMSLYSSRKRTLGLTSGSFLTRQSRAMSAELE